MTGFKPRYADIGFLYPTTRLGRLIAKIDGGPYSHVNLCLGAKWVDLSDYNVRFQLLKPGMRLDVFRPIKPLTAQERIRLWDFCQANRNRRYGYVTLLRLWWWYTLAKIFPINMKRVMLTGSGYVCSTFVDSAFKFAGRDLRPYLDESITGPRHLSFSYQLKEVCHNYIVPEVA